jgi:hypothetical protein
MVEQLHGKHMTLNSINSTSHQKIKTNADVLTQGDHHNHRSWWCLIGDFWVGIRASGRKLYVWVCTWHVGWGCACCELSAPCWSRVPLQWGLCLDSHWGSLTVHILHSNTQQCLRGHRAQNGGTGSWMSRWIWRCSSWGMGCTMCHY